MASPYGKTTTAHSTSSSDDLQLNEVVLEETLTSLEHLRIQFSRLKIKESAEVGSGGYGEVLLAKMDPLSPSPREVAVKQLRAVGMRGIRIRMAFRLARELKIWAKARHPNILELIGFYLSENYETAQLVSPYMPHGNVSQYIAKTKPEVGTRIEFVKDTAAGLEYLHTCDPPICHGDLKAANVLVTDDIRAILCDFGLAGVLESADDGPSGLTTSRTIRGSTRYMAPELILAMDGMPVRTLESDVWAWGCLLFEVRLGMLRAFVLYSQFCARWSFYSKIMTDTLPYASYRADIAVIQAIIRSQLPAELPPPSSLLEEEHWDLRSWFLQLVLPECWNFEPTKRPTMVDAVREMEFTLREIREELEKTLAASVDQGGHSRSASVETVTERSLMDLPLEERVRTILKRNREEEDIQESESNDASDSTESDARRKRSRLSSRRPTNSAVTIPRQESTASEIAYCYCNRRGIGPYMIRCDDYRCSRKWFDLDCLGLTEPPKGQWRCEACRARKRGEAVAG